MRIYFKIFGILFLLFLGVCLYQLFKTIFDISYRLLNHDAWVQMIPKWALLLLFSMLFGGIFLVIFLPGRIAKDMVFNSIDNKISGPSTEVTANVNSVKNSTWDLASPKGRISLTYLILVYTVDGTQYTNKLTISVLNVESFKFKMLRQVSILVDQNNPNNIALNWQWFGRERL